MLCCSSSFLSFLLPVLSAGFAFCLASAVVYILSLRMEFGVLLAAFHVKTRLSNQRFLRTCERGCFVLFLFPFLNALYALIVALPARGCGRACFLSCQLSWLVLLFRACLHHHLIGRLSPSPSIPLEMTLGSVDISACKDGLQSFVRSSTRFCFLILERFSRRERRSELGEVPLTSPQKKMRRVSSSCAGLPFTIHHSALPCSLWSLRLLLHVPIEAKELRGSHQLAIRWIEDNPARRGKWER